MLALGATRTAHASGFDQSRFGSDRGHAAAATPFATYYNPAALTGTRRAELALDVMVALRSASFERTASTVPEPPGAEGANVGRSELRDVIAGPALAASMRFGDLAVGLGAFAPLAGAARWKRNDAFVGNTQFPGAQDGRARWHMIEGTTQAIYLSAGLAYNFRKIGLSVGAGANLVYNDIDLVRASTLMQTDDVLREGRIHFAADGWVGSFGVGALWEILRERLFFGVSYQAPPGLYDGMVLEGKVRTDFGEVSSVRGDLHQTLPDIVRFALRLREPRYELRLLADFARWSVFENQCFAQPGAPCSARPDGSVSDEVRARLISITPRNWDDAWGLRFGGTYWFSPTWEGIATLGWDGNAVSDRMLEPTFPDAHDLSLQIGARYNFGRRASLSLAYTAVYWLPRDTRGKSALDELMPPGNLPTADGEYTQFVSLLNTFVQVYFD